jgi:hypothetical protein
VVCGVIRRRKSSGRHDRYPVSKKTRGHHLSYGLRNRSRKNLTHTQMVSPMRFTPAGFGRVLPPATRRRVRYPQPLRAAAAAAAKGTRSRMASHMRSQPTSAFLVYVIVPQGGGGVGMGTVAAVAGAGLVVGGLGVLAANGDLGGMGKLFLGRCSCSPKTFQY